MIRGIHMDPSALTALSPVDGRYAAAAAPLRDYFSEAALIRERIPARFHLDPFQDIQVLTPMHRGDAGTESLNRALQQALNPSGAALARGNRTPLRVDKNDRQAIRSLNAEQQARSRRDEPIANQQ